RASMPPAFPPERHGVLMERLAGLKKDSSYRSTPDTAGRLGKEHLYQNFVRNSKNNQGNHDIGFRVVHSDAVLHPRPAAAVFPLFGVKERQPEQRMGTDRPLYRIREVLPTPMDDSPDSILAFLPALGLPSGLLSHNHSPAMEVMPNGDVLMVIYTSVSETTHDVKLMVTRLRYGAREWDPPAILLDCADANDHAPLLWQDADTTWLVWGNNKYEASFPFQWTRSYDFGHTWEPVRFPVFRTPVLEHSAQPITSAFRDVSGTIYIGSDGVGSASVLWRSEDNGRTWIDPGGRTQGRHSAFLPLKDGRILAIGGKNSHFEGAMPKFLSSDKGASWTVERTPFMPLGSGQRPSAIRLRSGRILVSGDLDSRMGKLPDSLTRLPRNRGCYVAYSDDEGAHWTFKMLPGSQLGNTDDVDMRFRTLGYSVLRQGPNGNIHLIATVVHPVLHYEFNEAWLSNPDTLVSSWPGESSRIMSVRLIRERYADGRPKHEYRLARTADGMYWLHGQETWFDARGIRIYTSTHRLGEKTGLETFQPTGKLSWVTTHGLGVYERKTYHQNGSVRSVSRWKGMYADGEAVEYGIDGRLVQRLRFEHGELKSVMGHR
ncbi:MAG: exo-alpha-sialidase, partial [Chitinophagia bacterium]|nr:exo-alpha-sialidase [Chitinophagia bacterium]